MLRSRAILRSLAFACLALLAAACSRSERAESVTSSEIPAATPAPPPAPPPPRFHVADQNVDHVVLEQPGVGLVQLEKREGKWLLVAPKPERPADPSAVALLFSDLEGVEFVQPIRDRMLDRVHVLMKRGDVVVLDAWLGAKSEARAQLVRFQGSDEVWFVRRIPPWIYFATERDFRPKGK